MQAKDEKIHRRGLYRNNNNNSATRTFGWRSSFHDPAARGQRTRENTAEGTPRHGYEEPKIECAQAKLLYPSDVDVGASLNVGAER